MARVWSLARRYGLDVVTVVAAAAAMLEVGLGSDPEEPRTTEWFTVPAIGLVLLPLLLRRRLAFAAPASVWLLAAAISFVDGRLIPFAASASVGGFAAAFLLGNLRDSRQARLGLAIVLGGAAIVAYNDPSHAAGDVVFTPLLFGIGWVAGFATRERTQQAEAAEAAARLAVAEERARIARELHDVVAHAVSVMVLQVGAVRHGLAQGSPEDKAALEGVERTGRTALAEMRRLLGAMREEGEDASLAPQHGLANLATLLDQVGRAGLPVELRVEGEPYPLPQGLDATGYRIVQEGLTNALKHAHASDAEVVVRYAAGELGIEVRDNGSGAPPGNGEGHGLIGVRERVKIYGGEMSAGPASGGGFVLSTRLPVQGGQP